MGPRTKELLNVLGKLEMLLADSGELHWSTQISKVKSEIQSSDYHGIERLLSFYGTMGSFSDLVLGGSVSGGSIGLGKVSFSRADKRANNLLDDLRGEAYELADYVKRNQRIDS